VEFRYGNPWSLTEDFKGRAFNGLDHLYQDGPLLPADNRYDLTIKMIEGNRFILQAKHEGDVIAETVPFDMLPGSTLNLERSLYMTFTVKEA